MASSAKHILSFTSFIFFLYLLEVCLQVDANVFRSFFHQVVIMSIKSSHVRICFNCLGENGMPAVSQDKAAKILEGLAP